MRLRHVKSLIIVLVLTLAGAAHADQVDDYIRGQLQRQRIPGLSLVIIRNGAIVKAQGYGVTDLRRQTPATPETVYKIGSVSKPILAAGILLLAQNGQLSLTDRLVRFLDGAPASWSGITIRHLLTHTSGLVREPPGLDPFKIEREVEILRRAYESPLRFVPGEKWEYSNLGYFALAEVITRVTGRPWSDYIADHIFKPVHMQATRTTTTAAVPNRASGYSDNDKLLDAVDWPAVRPSGAFLSTVLDLAKFDAVLDNDTIFTAATRREMWTPVTLNDGTTYPYGAGWMLGPIGDHRAVHHAGGIPGFKAQFARFPDDRLTVIVLINLDDVDDDGIAAAVAAITLATSATTPAPAIGR